MPSPILLVSLATRIIFLYMPRPMLHRPTPRRSRRPSLLRLPERRLARRLAMGASAGRAARIEGFAEDDVTRLLGDETFRGIVEAYRGLYELPHGEALLRLLKISMGVIQEAVMEGRNGHVAAWVMWMAERGLDPAMSLAQQVVHAVERSGTAQLLRSGQAPPRSWSTSANSFWARISRGAVLRSTTPTPLAP